MKKILTIWRNIKGWITCLKNKLMELLNREQFNDMLKAVQKNQSVKAVLKEGQNSYQIEQIVFRGEKSYILVDQHGIPTAYTFDKIQSIKIEE